MGDMLGFKTLKNNFFVKEVGKDEFIPLDGEIKILETNDNDTEYDIDKQCIEQTIELLKDEKEFLTDAEYQEVFEEEYRIMKEEEELGLLEFHWVDGID